MLIKLIGGSLVQPAVMSTTTYPFTTIWSVIKHYGCSAYVIDDFGNLAEKLV